jgi:hypothetical protein
MVKDKVADFAKAVSRSSPENLFRKNKIFAEIQATVGEFCGKGESMVADYTRPFPPSVSACYESSRTNGGIQGHVRKEVLKHMVDTPYWQRIINIQKATDEDLGLGGRSQLAWEECLDEMFVQAVGEVGGVSESWSRLPVKPAGLTEPLKVRIVTKSNWFLQLLTPIQKAWHSKMRQHPVFQLMGGVDVEIALEGMLLKKGEKVVSGDYSAATDNIFLEYTRYAAECMLERTELVLSEDLKQYEPFIRRLVIHSLTQSELHVGASTSPITRGQMMGHILSFPLLCVINRAASCMAVPRDRFMRINGDDVIFPASEKEYNRWKSATRCVGLEFSVGKNYYSRDLALVNSVYCTFDKKQGRWVSLPVPNVGLLNSPVDLKTVDAVNGRQIMPWETLAQLWKTFFSACHKKKLIRTYEQMFRKYYPILHSFPGPIYGPVEYGAFGAPVPEGHQFTRNQLMWMNAHRLGIFNYLEGTRSDYSSITTRYQRFLEDVRYKGQMSFRTPEYGDAFGPPDQAHLISDPYARDGGMSNGLMAMRRWMVELQSEKKVRIFSARRWNKFKLSRAKSGGIPPLPANYLHKVLENAAHFPRPAWARHRDMLGSRYEDSALYLHEIFQAPH